MASAGYSGTPLHRKLGLKDGLRVGLLRPPDHLDELLEGTPPSVARVRFRAAGSLYDGVLLFAADEAGLGAQLPRAVARIEVDGWIWVCWPKKSSPLFVDLTEDGVRAAALPLRLVDVKVCAVDQDWSGLKLVFRKEVRPAVLRERERR